MRRVALCLIISSSLLSTSCYTAGVVSPASRGGRQHQDLGASWFWGLGHAVTDADECPQGLAEVRTHFPWYGLIVSGITLGIFTPIKRHYYCVER